MALPQNLTAVECEKRVKVLESLAEACRTGAPVAPCILAPEDNGSTEEQPERHDVCVVVW
ncbi:hypothetical protein COMA1_20301 [Candidatus Nitrospira nitrosa]|uniref:Uncharacterized protein n=1 Tax=Candidatus Nitrospira nitrosa TaxID=1742972 RepID=A0A0S4LF35_9BACT|nr:hypothetical protein COMA1_20301 [Candidatus Nitrospira nitrosa]